MRKLLAFTIISIIFIAGCSTIVSKIESSFFYNTTPIEKTVYIDHSFSTDEEKDITNSLKSWEASLNYMVRFKIYYNAYYDNFTYADVKSVFIWKTDGNDQRIVDVDKTLPKNDDGSNRFVIGLHILRTNEQPSVILLCMDRIHGNLWQVSAHEIGHELIGQNHNDSANSIMNARIEVGASKITELDIRSVCNIYHFNPSGMKPWNIQ